ncbi:nuclease-related domain-containing protein [Pseudokineococcus basanitobsidens]|uniref:Nuclease-related domain-containing protein n=1 Tax=Pseudokineococcus basanitobsidens TaxID=1926649 RepID=A0ABU8RFL9_9ACTN
MSELEVRPWRRYGHDRLYVQRPDGERLGYWDCAAGTAVLADGCDDAGRAAFDAALAHHPGVVRPRAAPEQLDVAAEEAVGVPVPRASAAAEVSAAVPVLPVREAAAEVPWTDLAATRPGAAARAKALELRQTSPVRTFLTRLLGVHTEERAWRIGADGEEAVAAQLLRLGERWKVLHAVPVGDRGSDIDHVVVGPGGVFTVNTKHHPRARVWIGGGTFIVNGQRVPYVRNSRHEARRAARLLAAAGAGPVDVTGVVAVVGARGGLTIRRQPDDVVVVTSRRRLARWLAAQPERLTDGEVARLHDIARRSDTWVRPSGR